MFSIFLGTGLPQIHSMITNTHLAPSRAGIGKMLNSARFIASIGSKSKKLLKPSFETSAIWEIAVIVPPSSLRAVLPVKIPPRAFKISPQI